MSLFAWGSIHQGLDPERFSDESRGRQEIYMCLAAPFDDSRTYGDAKISIKSSFMEFFLCEFNRSDVPGKICSVRSKLPTLSCWSGRKVWERYEANQLCVSDFVPLTIN